MPHVKIVPPEAATGSLADVYRKIEGARGGVAMVHQVLSLYPKAIETHLELYKTVMFRRYALSRIERERIAVVVSHTNDCAYCVAHHAQALRSLNDDSAVVSALSAGKWSGLSESVLPAKDRSLLDFAHASTHAPSEAKVSLLKNHYDDKAIIDATLVISYFNFVNRIVLLLGADLEEDFVRTCGPLATDAP